MNKKKNTMIFEKAFKIAFVFLETIEILIEI